MIDDKVLLNDWHVVAHSKDLPEGGVKRVRLLDEDIVLWRANGQVMAWKDLCVHRGAALSLGKVTNDGLLMCAYHGWTYDSGGQCVKIPAHPEQVPPTRARTIPYKAQECYDWIWVSLGEPTLGVPAFDEWDDPSFRNIFCGPYYFKASAPRVVENFLDVAHFAFVHEGYLGDQEHAEIDDYEVETTADGVIARDIAIWQPNPDGTGIGKKVSYTYHVRRPLTAYFVKNMEQQFSILFNVTPVSQVESIGWMWMNYNYGFDLPEEELRHFQDVVAGQDVPIVESQRPELLPLDLQAELHLRSDRTAIGYRKWLRELGLSFGTQ